ncbi:MAG: 50S ribosomal protein L30 [Myxococcales bacterium]|nr:MAG: 50S ribosomal protein L30 [Myxococcales bacterium]
MANLKITQIKSVIGRPQYQRRVLAGLGIKRMNHTVIRLDTPEMRGMIFKIKHLLTVEETNEPLTPSKSPKRAQAVKASDAE